MRVRYCFFSSGSAFYRVSSAGLFEAPRAKKAKYSPFDKLRNKKKQPEDSKRVPRGRDGNKRNDGRDKYFATKNSMKSPRTNKTFGKKR
jgi:hypothetical protein